MKSLDKGLGIAPHSTHFLEKTPRNSEKLPMGEDSQSWFKNMVPVPISDFISGLSIPVDLYVKLGEDKYVMVARQVLVKL